MSEKGYTKLDSFRYERKYVIDKLDWNRLEVLLKTHPANFSQSYAPRWVNNIYFDTPALNYYLDNHHGKDNRFKARIRWYGELFGEHKPILEFKIKRGLTGIKDSFFLLPFEMSENLTTDQMAKLIKNSDIDETAKEKVSQLVPVLINRYERKYFETFDKKFRVTIDTNLEYFQPRSTGIDTNRKYSEADKIVLELKYDKSNNALVNDITDYLGLRLSKNSKYVTGIDFLYSAIRV